MGRQGMHGGAEPHLSTGVSLVANENYSQYDVGLVGQPAPQPQPTTSLKASQSLSGSPVRGATTMIREKFPCPTHVLVLLPGVRIPLPPR
jgi:hypothetical protein